MFPCHWGSKTAYKWFTDHVLHFTKFTNTLRCFCNDCKRTCHFVSPRPRSNSQPVANFPIFNFLFTTFSHANFASIRHTHSSATCSFAKFSRADYWLNDSEATIIVRVFPPRANKKKPPRKRQWIMNELSPPQQVPQNGGIAIHLGTYFTACRCKKNAVPEIGKQPSAAVGDCNSFSPCVAARKNLPQNRSAWISVRTFEVGCERTFNPYLISKSFHCHLMLSPPPPKKRTSFEWE